MNTDIFDYPLPEELIAQVPAERRDESRLLVYDRATGKTEHTIFRYLPEYLPEKLTVFRNSASVFKARLRGRRVTGGAVECLLLHPDREPHTFWCLLKPGKKLPVGSHFLGNGFRADVLAVKDTGERQVRFTLEAADNVIALAESIGEIPLPPYIERAREADPALREMDALRYQTVYADPAKKVAAAAPTAGLHFTPQLLEYLKARGAHFHDIRLHVGLDTFQPIKADTIEEHIIHREIYEIPEATARVLSEAPTAPRLCIGTTSVRACEDFCKKTATEPYRGEGSFLAEADLFLYPPARFLATDLLLTNFHLPRSTLLCLVSAFLAPGETNGIKILKALYAEAIAMRYRFYSYGDAMLIR